MKLILTFILLSVSLTCLSTPAEQYPFESQQKRKQFQGLLRELRCLVCQNQDLADSNATLAMDLKAMVYDKVNKNESNSEIKAFLSQRFGDFVLFKPPVKEQTYLLWFGPFVMLLIGLVCLVRLVLRMRKND